MIRKSRTGHTHSPVGLTSNMASMKVLPLTWLCSLISARCKVITWWKTYRPLKTFSRNNGLFFRKVLNCLTGAICFIPAGSGLPLLDFMEWKVNWLMGKRLTKTQLKQNCWTLRKSRVEPLKAQDSAFSTQWLEILMPGLLTLWAINENTWPNLWPISISW